MRARRAFVASTIANEFGTFDDDGGHTQPAYAQPESNVPMPMEPMANLNIGLPTEAQIGKAISTKANTYLECARGDSNDSARNGLRLPHRKPPPHGRPCQP